MYRTNKDNTKTISNDTHQAFKKLVSLLNYRDRTSFELNEKLQAAHFNECAACAAIEHAKELGLVDDNRFVEHYLEQAFRSGKGKRRVINELKRKGIEESSVQQHIHTSSFASEDENERAFHFLEKHPSRGKNVQQNAFRKLVIKGYSVSAASYASHKFADEQFTENSETGIE